jgi:hypothetical protein
MKAWEYKKIKFMCKGIHCEKSTYVNQSAQWNQGARVNNLVDEVVKFHSL